MGHPAHHHKINYVELSATNVGKAKDFYSSVFGWNFQDWGAEYIGFDKDSAGMDGGFRLSNEGESGSGSGPLVVLYSADLQATQDAIVAAGGSIVVPTFEFPGGRRFHFSDGVGNVLAVWSE
jgi:predicted enzyme related to lactoylglutathione lyase